MFSLQLRSWHESGGVAARLTKVSTGGSSAKCRGGDVSRTSELKSTCLPRDFTMRCSPRCTSVLHPGMGYGRELRPSSITLDICGEFHP
jgi:hypothetical protein